MVYDNNDKTISLGNRRLLALADVLDDIPTTQYNQSMFRAEGECGTVCCALGWGAEKIPEVIGLRFKRSDDSTMERIDGSETSSMLDNFDLAEEVFELTSDETAMLFSCGKETMEFYDTTRPSPDIVAAKIREFAMQRIGAVK